MVTEQLEILNLVCRRVGITKLLQEEGKTLREKTLCGSREKQVMVCGL